MASTPYSLTPEWTAANRYTAAAAVDIRLSNRDPGRAIYFTITTSDVIPTVAVDEASILAPYDAQAMTLSNGDRVWMASLHPAGVTIED